MDLGVGHVTFARAVVDGDEGIAVKGTKTGRVYRVRLDPDSVAAVVEHRAACEAAAVACGARLRGGSFVFSYDVDGARPWRPDGVSKRWATWRDKAGLDGVRLHDLRHFMATTMLTAGVPVSVVAGRLGHARAATTLNVYSHFVEAGDEAAAVALGDILSGGPERADPG
jgi:integrase